VFEATLTLPGMAGIVLTIGMAVDANVIIFERIREELAIGKTPRAAIDSGYAKAFSTIVDANVTTFIAGVVLMQYGSGPVRGFAVTLIAGILCSMFTAIYVTRLIYDFFSSRRRLETLSI
jgi:preprotein translocase subunit SecD